MTVVTMVSQENAGQDACNTPKCCCYLKIPCNQCITSGKTPGHSHAEYVQVAT